MAADEYRVEVNLDDEGHGRPLSERLAALHLDDEVKERLGDRVIVTREGPKLFVYAGSREALAEADRIVAEILAEDGLTAELTNARWNEGGQVWQDPDEPLDADQTLRAAPEEQPGQHPLFVYIESHRPHFLRNLGV